MKVILAEKPSVARDIAAFLGCKVRRDGYLEGNGYQITWAFGHLVALNDPEDYDPALKKSALETLPIIPEKFGLKPSGDKQARHQFSVIKQLFRTADELIAATDAGREGELIFRYILTLTGCTGKPARRLWLSSLTPQAIQEAFALLRPLAAYDNLYAAARCRSEADWIVGINGTRYFTVRHRQSGELWSVGRVQTPVLAMIAGRDNEIKNFRPTPFWELLTKYRDTVFRFAGGRFEEEANARTHLQRVTGPPLKIESVEIQPQKAQPPQLYDLNELQRDMNRRFGLSAAATLQAAQSLYEARLVTYPRTDSRYLTKDIEPTVPGILHKLAALKPTEIGRLDLAKLPFTARITNDKKVTDHHAIIPTGTTPASLPPDQQQVFEAIVVRFIAAFSPACEKQITTVEAQVAGVPFVAKGTRITVPGWTLLYEHESNDEATEDEQQLPDFKPGESGTHEPSVRKGQTTPPSPFTENTLLGAMETAGKFVEDAELREALKERGLGTPATRASIIETLIQRKYILRTKTKLTATQSGHYLLSLI
ncbi:MAG: DNA topoisomerase 3, partial [Pirellulales bacterium]